MLKTLWRTPIRTLCSANVSFCSPVSILTSISRTAECKKRIPIQPYLLSHFNNQRYSSTSTTTTDGLQSNIGLINLSPAQQLFASVVKVFCDHTDPNFCQPWQMRRQCSSSGSGFAIKGKRLMTNAHCVAYHNRVLVRKPGDARRFPAEVEAVSHEADLALLSVADDEFWLNLPELPFGELPQLQDNVCVVGYPTGGDNLSITAGVVSRLDVTTYAHSNFKLLCAQIDAAINPGNSGGPAFKFPEGVVVGVAFQGFSDSQNIGYVVPTNVIRHFLADVEKHKKATGFVSLGVSYQTLENPALRKYFGLDDINKSQLPSEVSPTGILIVQVDELRNKQFTGERKRKQKGALRRVDSSVDGIEDELYGFKKSDVLLALDNIDVADDATIHFRGMERVHLSHCISEFFSGDSIPALILRDKKIMTVQVPLYPPQYLIPEHQWDKMSRYYIYGGLVFVPLTIDYLKDEFGKKYYERAPAQLLEPLSQLFPKQSEQEVVILSQILASDLTIGYDVKNSRLHKVDGTAVNNMPHLMTILSQNSNQQFVEFEFDHEVRIILDRNSVREKSPSILEQHAIVKPFSSDLQSFIEQLESNPKLNADSL